MSGRHVIRADDDGMVVLVRDAEDRIAFEIIAGTDERGAYVQVRGARLLPITVEPRADNVVRVREAGR